MTSGAGAGLAGTGTGRAQAELCAAQVLVAAFGAGLRTLHERTLRALSRSVPVSSATQDEGSCPSLPPFPPHHPRSTIPHIRSRPPCSVFRNLSAGIDCRCKTPVRHSMLCEYVNNYVNGVVGLVTVISYHKSGC